MINHQVDLSHTSIAKTELFGEIRFQQLLYT